MRASSARADKCKAKCLPIEAGLNTDGCRNVQNHPWNQDCSNEKEGGSNKVLSFCQVRTSCGLNLGSLLS